MTVKRRSYRPRAEYNLRSDLAESPSGNYVLLLQSLGVVPPPTHGKCITLVQYFDMARNGMSDDKYYNQRVSQFRQLQETMLGKSVRYKKGKEGSLGIVDHLFVKPQPLGIQAVIKHSDGSHRNIKADRLEPCE